MSAVRHASVPRCARARARARKRLRTWPTNANAWFIVRRPSFVFAFVFMFRGAHVVVCRWMKNDDVVHANEKADDLVAYRTFRPCVSIRPSIHPFIDDSAMSSSSKKTSAKSARGGAGAGAAAGGAGGAAGGGRMADLKVNFESGMSVDDVRKASEKAEARGYEYAYETPDRKLTVQETMAIVIALRQDFQKEVLAEVARVRRELEALHRRPPTSAEIRARLPSVEEVRERLKKRSETYTLFSRKKDHQRMFETIASYSLTEVGCQRVFELLKLRERMDAGKISREEAEEIIRRVAQKDMSKAKIQAAMSKTAVGSSKFRKLKAELAKLEKLPAMVPTSR